MYSEQLFQYNEKKLHFDINTNINTITNKKNDIATNNNVDNKNTATKTIIIII